MQRRPDKKIWCPPPNPSTSRHESEQCQNQKACNDNKALLTREPSRAPDRRIGGKRTAPRYVIRLVKWTEFKPSRSTRST